MKELTGKLREVWKDIDGFEGYYQVSNTGRVRSLDRQIPNSVGEGFRTMKGKEMTLTISGHGYRVAALTKQGKTSPALLHRLLAIAFIENTKNKPCINHKDGNKLNNNLSNLEWVTYKENNIHAFETGLQKGVPMSEENKRKMSERLKGKPPPITGRDSRILKTCAYCKKEYRAYPYKNKKYCSKECRCDDMIGKPARNPNGRKGKQKL